MLCILEVTQTGTLYVYQGQELGLKNFPRSWGLEEYKDVATLNYYNLSVFASQAKAWLTNRTNSDPPVTLGSRRNGRRRRERRMLICQTYSTISNRKPAITHARPCRYVLGSAHTSLQHTHRSKPMFTTTSPSFVSSSYGIAPLPFCLVGQFSQWGFHHGHPLDASQR